MALAAAWLRALWSDTFVARRPLYCVTCFLGKSLAASSGPGNGSKCLLLVLHRTAAVVRSKALIPCCAFSQSRLHSVMCQRSGATKRCTQGPATTNLAGEGSMQHPSSHWSEASTGFIQRPGRAAVHAPQIL